MKWKPGRPQILVAMGCITGIAVACMCLQPDMAKEIATLSITPLALLGMKLLEGE